MANWYGMSRTNYFRVRDETVFRAWVDTLPGVVLIDDGEGKFGFYADGDGDWPSSRYDEASDTWSDFSLYDELAPCLADSEVAVLITVGHEKARYGTGVATAIRYDGETLDMNINDIYALVHGTWGIEPSRAEY